MTMRERIARALAARGNGLSWEARLADVDTALAVLREPNRPMLQAGMRELGTEDHRPLGPMWRAMIDAAAEEVG